MKEFFTVIDGKWYKGVFAKPVALEEVLVETTSETGGGIHKMLQFIAPPLIARLEEVPDEAEQHAEVE